MMSRNELKTVGDWTEKLGEYPVDTELVIRVQGENFYCDEVRAVLNKKQFCGECDIVFLDIVTSVLRMVYVKDTP